MIDNEYLKKRAAQLNLGRGDLLVRIQTELDQLYPGQIRALSLNDSVLRLVTPNASVASDLRMRQVELQAKFGKEVARLQIQVGTL